MAFPEVNPISENPELISNKRPQSSSVDDANKILEVLEKEITEDSWTQEVDNDIELGAPTTTFKSI